MSESINRTVTFGTLKPEAGGGGYGQVTFTIQPPIEVHNPTFLQKAVEKTPGNHWAFGDFNLTDGVVLNFSDEFGTYGSVTAHTGVESEKFQAVMTKAFSSALGVGGAVLHFSFPEEQ